MATKNTTKSAQKATTGAKVEKVTKVSKKAAGNVAATEKAGLKTKPGQGQKAAPAGGQQKAAAPKGKGKGKGAGKPKAAPKGGQQQGQRGRASEFPLETKVRAVADVELREGSFAQKISAMAAKPITIGELIEAATKKRGEFFRTSAAAESADAARRALTVRIRDLIRNEYLTTV